MRRGGHANPTAALRYQHATEDRDRAIADARAALVAGQITPLKGRKQASTTSRRRTSRS